MRKYRCHWTTPSGGKPCNVEYDTMKAALYHVGYLNKMEGYEAVVQTRLPPEWETITQEPDFT